MILHSNINLKVDKLSHIEIPSKYKKCNIPNLVFSKKALVLSSHPIRIISWKLKLPQIQKLLKMVENLKEMLIFHMENHP